MCGFSDLVTQSRSGRPALLPADEEMGIRDRRMERGDEKRERWRVVWEMGQKEVEGVLFKGAYFCDASQLRLGCWTVWEFSAVCVDDS